MSRVAAWRADVQGLASEWSDLPARTSVREAATCGLWLLPSPSALDSLNHGMTWAREYEEESRPNQSSPFSSSPIVPVACRLVS
jgi:hypothetical protein